MHFGQTSEKLSADIAQLELLLEDLEASQAAAGAAAILAHRAGARPSSDHRQGSRRSRPARACSGLKVC